MLIAVRVFGETAGEEGIHHRQCREKQGKKYQFLTAPVKGYCLRGREGQRLNPYLGSVDVLGIYHFSLRIHFRLFSTQVSF